MASIIARTIRPATVRLSAKSASSWRPAAPSMRSFSASVSAHVKKYTKDHEWIELSSDNKTGTIGISDYAAHALGDVVYVELPTVPMEVAAGDAIGAVESVKSASDINSPISCTITEVNTLLEDKPGSINKAPEDDNVGGGWVAKVEVGEEGVKNLGELMDEGEYKAFTEE
ncbi:MAG: hypothetical protein M1818_001718 [Claussenomyces sp. TS43310]|nr:MAG: hypothetical protein M1818_001718 [Claussenomyces sp. TS43310]